MIPSQFIAIGVVLIVALVLLMGASAGNPLVPLLVAVFPMGVFLVSRPDAWLAILVAIAWSRLTFPGAPINLNTFHVLSAGFVVFAVLYRMMHSTTPRRSPVHKYVFAFGVILVLVALHNGVGVRALGSNLWGGSPYVILLISCLMVFASNAVTLSVRAWRRALIAMCLLSYLPVVAQSIFVFSGGRVVLQYAFVQPTGFIMQTLSAVTSEADIARYSTDYGVTLLYLPLLLFQNPTQGRAAVVTVFAFLASLAVAGLSGSRYSMVMVVGFVAFWTLLDGARIRWGRAISVFMAALLVLAVAALFARSFPTPIQRALSFIPWADVSTTAQLDATGTATWRLDVWERAIREDLPRYWLTGRGFAFNPRDYEAIQKLGLFVRDWAFVTGSYHSGPLSLIINLGIAGFVVGLGFFWSTFREHLRMLRSGIQDPQLARIYLLVLAMFANQSFLFLTLGGDVQNYFPNFLFLAMVLEGLARTREAERVAEAPAEALVDADAVPAIAGGAVTQQQER